MRVSAEYHNGTSSHREKIELMLDEHGIIHLYFGDTNEDYSLEEVSFSSRLGNTPRLLSLPNNAACHIYDNDAVDAFLKEHQPNTTTSFLHLLESHMAYVLAAVLFTAIFSWSMFTYGIPYLSAKIAYNLPADIDRSLGSGTLETLDKVFFSASELDESAKEKLLERFEKIQAGISGSDDYQLLFRHGDKIGANAFALPSGIIIITDELVELSEDQDEVIAIIAHEIGHLQHRHSVRMVLQNSAVAVLVATITGDPFSTSSLVVALPTLLAHSKYSRDFETEADDYAYHFLLDNNIETSTFSNMLERITDDAKESGIEVYLSSHPTTIDRLQRFK